MTIVSPALQRLTTAELVKFGSVRSHLVALAVGGVGVIAMAVALAATADDPAGPAGPVAPEPVALPMEYFAYVLMVLGALVATSDFRTGTYRVTAALAPWPERILLAKYAVVALVGAGTGALVLVAVVVGAALGGDVRIADLLEGEPLVTTLCGLAAVPLAALLGVAVGALARSTAAAVTLLLLWALGIETVLVFVLPESVAAYLPFKTVGGSRVLLDELSAGAGLGWFALYTAALLVLAFAVHRRRDAPQE